jgi:hypothetical protein
MFRFTIRDVLQTCDSILPAAERRLEYSPWREPGVLETQPISIQAPKGRHSISQTRECFPPYNIRMQYRLRTLLIVLALGPMVLAVVWFGYDEYRFRQMVRNAEGRQEVFISRDVDLSMTDEEANELDQLYRELSASQR